MDVGPSKPTSVYYAEEENRANHLRWPIPLGGPKNFYTSWNAVAGILVTIFAIICIPLMRINKTSQKIAAFTIIPMAIATMASIVCTTIISQMMLAFTVKIERTSEEPEEHKGKKLTLGVKFVQKMLAYNFVWHILILVLAVVLGLAITFMPSPSTLLGKGSVFLMSFLYFTIFVLAWFLTPCDIDNNDGTDPVTVIGWEKIEYVYRKPKKYYFTVVFPIIALFMLAVGNFALYGALDSKGMSSF